MDDDQNSEFQKEDEKAINLVKSASKNLRNVKKRVLKKETLKTGVRKKGPKK